MLKIFWEIMERLGERGHLMNTLRATKITFQRTINHDRKTLRMKNSTNKQDKLRRKAKLDKLDNEKSHSIDKLSPSIFFLSTCLIIFWAKLILPLISLPLIKAPRRWEIMLGRIGSILFAKILVKTFSKKIKNLIGLKSEKKLRFSLLEIKGIKL